MKKVALISFVVLVLVVGLAALGFWWMTQQPFYQPGMVRAGQNLQAPLAPPAQKGDPDYWQVEPDIRLYHFSQGTGRNVVVIHGGPGVPFREPINALEPLTGEYRFHYYDQRGSGKSTRPFNRFSSPNTYQNMTELDRTLGLGAQIADIERIRQILGDEKLILIGHSWGGFLASLYAAEFPEHVEALILVSPATTLVMPQKEPDFYEAVRARLPQDQWAEYDAFMANYWDFNNLFSHSEADLVALNNRYAEQYILRVEKDIITKRGETGGWMTWAMYISMGQRHDYRAALKKVSAPVLVLHGENDLLSEAATRQYVDSFPNARFAIIKNAGHFSFEQQPEQFTKLVADFLQGK
jgi:proline iminopeptidase